MENNFKELTNLDGIGFATASAILHFMFPDNYAIIDKNAIKGVNKEKNKELEELEYNKINHNIKVYKKYLDFLEKKKDENNSLRKVEFDYFKKGRGNGK